MRAVPLIAALILVVAATSPGPQTPQLPAWSVSVTPVPSPAQAASAQPHLTASARGVLLSWIERDGPRATLKFAERTPSGWTAPRTVATGENWFVNWADVPSVVRLPSGAIVGHWLQKSGPDTYAYDVRLAYSTDDGRTFSPSFLPHHDGTKTEHGFASLFPTAAGLGLVWLDGRATQSASHDGAAHQQPGAMTLRYAAFDGQWKQVADLAVDTRVCDCCPTTAVMTSDGPIVAYRDRSEGEIRDIHVSRLENGAWTPSTAVADDNWHIAACPVNGPMLSARGRDVVLAWFTAADKQPRAFAAFSRDAGRTFGAPIRIDDHGTLGRVDVEWLDDGSAVVSWIENATDGAAFRIRRIDPAGVRTAAVTVATVVGDRTSGYPRIARHGDELVMAWVDVGPRQASGPPSLQVRTAVTTVPVRGR